MLTKKISKIFEDFSIQFEELLFDYETYEEPLLVNTCSEIQEISKEINFEDLNTFYMLEKIWEKRSFLIFLYV